MSEDASEVTGDPSVDETEGFVTSFLFGGEDEIAKHGGGGGGTSGPSDLTSSKQITLDSFDYSGGSRAIAPPYNPLLWAQLLEKSTRLQSCIWAMAQNVCGLGWFIRPRRKVTEKTTPEIRERIDAETAMLEALFSNPNDEMPITRLFKLAKIDEESTGNGYVEVVRDIDGFPVALHHVPAHTMRVDRKGGYVQRRGGKSRYFRAFGSTMEKHAETGVFGTAEEIPFQDRATEIIHFRIYTPRDSFYGVPRAVAAAPAITGNRLAAVRNAAFFENDAVPRLAILISGGHLTETAAANIKNFLRSDGKGPAKAHRVMVVEAEGKKVALGKQEGVKIALERLTVGETDDASFQEYRKANDEEIREIFRIANIFLGTAENTNRASAFVARRITNEQVFIPEQKEWEYVINHTIVKATGAEHVVFQFERPHASDPVDMASADNVHATHGALTPNDIRQERGLDPFPPGTDFADLPFALAKLAFMAKLQGAGRLPASAAAAEEQQSSFTSLMLDLRKAIAVEIEKIRDEGVEQEEIEAGDRDIAALLRSVESGNGNGG